MLTERSFPFCQGSRLTGVRAGRLQIVLPQNRARAIQESPNFLYSPYRYSIAPIRTNTTAIKNNCSIVLPGIDEDMFSIIAPTDTPTPKFLKVSPKNLLSLFTLFTSEYFNGGKKCSG